MKKFKIKTSKTLIAIVMLLFGLLIGRWVFRGDEPPSATFDAVPETNETTIWTCSMDPQVRQMEPGKCPICGMDLIPLVSDLGSDDPLEIRMSPTAIRLANIQTMVVDFGKATREVRLSGKVQADERLISSQVSHLEGRVESLSTNFTGEYISKGQVLATIYSPALVTAQQELFSAQKIKQNQPQLFEAAKAKLKNWKLTDEQIEEILASGQAEENFPILADVNGIVMDRKVNLGDYVMRGMSLYEIADLSRVWVLFDVYESDIPWVRINSTVEFSIQSLPGEIFKGRVSFIDPVINPVTRVATARVEMTNRGGRLKPEMFASGTITSNLPQYRDKLVIPKSAVMWTGPRSVVYIKTENEKGIGFLMREVTLGPDMENSYVIIDGLEPGIEVVVNGTFAIDAAAQLAGKPSMMNPEGGPMMTGHQHGDQAKEQASMDKMPVSANAQSALGKLFDHYFELKDALVGGNFTVALQKSKDLKKRFENIPMDLFTGKAHDHWMTHSSASVKLLESMSQALDVELLRRDFKPLSEQLVDIAMTFGPLEKPIYVQHCPMADNNNGADWLSLDEKILNPYFGEMMLTCGKVTSTIK